MDGLCFSNRKKTLKLAVMVCWTKIPRKNGFRFFVRYLSVYLGIVSVGILLPSTASPGGKITHGGFAPP